MALMDSNPTIWEQIERSESYLVASMYEEAASLASSVLSRICNYKNNNNNNNNSNVGIEGYELNDMMVSAGMVLVQSLSLLGRASDILKELKLLFLSVDAIPFQVLRTGVCFQISEGSPLGVQEFLEEFFSKWHFVDGQYYVLLGAQTDAKQGFEESGILGIDEYMEVVEIYAVMLLGTALKDLDLAITWVEKAALPVERRQELLRRLHSLYSLKVTNSSQGSSVLPENDHDSHSLLSKELNVPKKTLNALETNHLPVGENNTKQAILKFSKRTDPFFWWFRSVNLKFGNARFYITNGKIFLGCLVFFIYYVLRRKQFTLKGIVKKQVLSLKKAMIDLWHLTFSYQVNPLAAVQPLPAATRGGR